MMTHGSGRGRDRRAFGLGCLAGSGATAATVALLLVASGSRRPRPTVKVLAKALKSYKDENGELRERLKLRWVNQGRATVQEMRGRVTAYDASGDVQYDRSDVVVYLSDDGTPAGATHDDFERSKGANAGTEMGLRRGAPRDAGRGRDHLRRSARARDQARLRRRPKPGHDARVALWEERGCPANPATPNRRSLMRRGAAPGSPGSSSRSRKVRRCSSWVRICAWRSEDADSGGLWTTTAATGGSSSSARPSRGWRQDGQDERGRLPRPEDDGPSRVDRNLARCARRRLGRGEGPSPRRLCDDRSSLPSQNASFLRRALRLGL